MNQNKNIKIEKITFNLGAGKDQNLLEKGMKLIEYMTGVKPIKTTAKKRIPVWGLRPGLPIGCKLTLRGKDKIELLARLLKAKNNALNRSNFDQQGNISFGIHEYIDVPDVKYNPDLGLLGFQVCVTLERNGYRIKKRRIMTKQLPKRHVITQDEGIEFIKKQFNIKVEEN